MLWGTQTQLGFSIKISNIPKLINYANKKLKNIDFTKLNLVVDFVEQATHPIKDLIFDIDDGRKLWGQGCPEPLIAVLGLIINKNNIDIIGKNKDTLKFTYKGVCYICFRAKKQIEQLSKFKDSILINLIGTANLNEYNGITTPQIMIKDIEFQTYTDDLFADF